jgi:hypothetical protein
MGRLTPAANQPPQSTTRNTEGAISIPIKRSRFAAVCERNEKKVPVQFGSNRRKTGKKYFNNKVRIINYTTI